MENEGDGEKMMMEEGRKRMRDGDEGGVNKRKRKEEKNVMR